MKYPATLEWVGDCLMCEGVVIAFVHPVHEHWSWKCLFSGMDGFTSPEASMAAVERHFGINTKEKE
jgi:hypothetical protein